MKLKHATSCLHISHIDTDMQKARDIHNKTAVGAFTHNHNYCVLHNRKCQARFLKKLCQH